MRYASWRDLIISRQQSHRRGRVVRNRASNGAHCVRGAAIKRVSERDLALNNECEITDMEAAHVTIQITSPEVEALINRRLETGAFKDAEEVILHALKSSGTKGRGINEKRREAIERLRTFGKMHGLSLGGMTIRELRHTARP